MDQQFALQFTADRFGVKRYNTKQAWVNYWYQIDAVFRTSPQSVLEIGPGNQTVTDVLKKSGVHVTTVDVDPELKPDVVASVAKLPFQDDSFDTVLCSEVLEHLPFEQFSVALGELRRVAKNNVVLGLPNAGAVILFRVKLPLLPTIEMFAKVPFFWKKHVFRSGHYWETGKRGYGRGRIRGILGAAGFRILREGIRSDDPAHWLMELEKISP